MTIFENPSNTRYGVSVHVWGEYACFTRPEMKVERVSYEVPTPAAARGILEAILWKPAIAWRVRRIEVLNPIAWATIRRNEVGSVGAWRDAVQAAKHGTLPRGILVEDVRQQRASLVLRNVAYVIHADFSLTSEAGPDDIPGKFLDMFHRRIEKGQCHKQPYLGTREFVAFFGPPPSHRRPIPPGERDLGWMFYDFDYSQSPPEPRFFRAVLTDGVLSIPSFPPAEEAS